MNDNSAAPMPTELAGRPEAAAEIWRWKDSDLLAQPEHASAQSARIGGTIRALVVGAFSLLVWFFWSQTLAKVVATVAVVILLSALLSPRRAYAAIEGLFSWLGQMTGEALVWILMAPIFYLIFLPFGALFRRGAKDPLKRRIERELPTYWEPHQRPQTPAARERQY